MRSKTLYALCLAVVATLSAGLAAGKGYKVAVPRVGSGIVFLKFGMLKTRSLRQAAEREISIVDAPLSEFWVAPNGRFAVVVEDHSRFIVVDLWSHNRWTVPALEAGEVAWRPDSSAFVYTSHKGQLHLWSLKTHQQRRLLEGFGYHTPVWSPRGDTFAGVRTTKPSDEYGSLCLVSPSIKSRAKVLLKGQWKSPTWSPGGDHLAAICQSQGAAHDIAAVIALKSKKVTLLKGLDRVQEISWAPQGNIIALTRSVRDTGPRGGDWEGELSLVNVTTKVHHRLMVGQPTDLHWNDTATKILFTNWRGGHRPDIWEIDPHTKIQLRLAEYGSAGQYARIAAK